MKLSKAQSKFLDMLGNSVESESDWVEVYRFERRTASSLEKQGLVELGRVNGNVTEARLAQHSESGD